MKLWSLCLALLLAFASLDADAARRLGGGQSAGRQSSNVTQREAARPAAAPQQQPQAGATQASPQPAAAAAQPRRPWGAMLGGLAAGLGLAWLAHSLGLGEAFGSVLLVLLLGFLAVALITAFLRARRVAAAPRPAYAGVPADVAQPPPQYDPSKLGNDASARPWERNTTSFEAPQPPAVRGVQIGSALQGSPNWSIPADFDVAGFVAAAKRNFITLQEAWDRADVAALRSMMTDAMLAEVRSQLAERDRHQGGQPNHTEVVLLDAQLLGIEDLGDGYMASIEFSGMIREDPSAGPSPFREVWNMTKPRDGSSGWLVAGLQALQ